MAGPNTAMTMGSYGHKMLEIYYKGRSKGYGISACLDHAMSFDPDKETCRCGHGKEHHAPVVFIEEPHERDTFKCMAAGCECENLDFQPFPLEPDKKELVKERIRVYVYTYSLNDFIPRTPEHVEVGFSHKLYEDDEKLYILEGRYDLLVNHNGLETWADHKCQMSAYDLYTKDIQFRNYDLVTEAAIACINYIRLTKKVDTTTYVRQWFSFSKMEREFWRRRLIGIYDQMLRVELTGIQPEDYKWNMCKGKFKNAKCPFTPLCEEAFIPDVVAQKKLTLYHKKQEWKPW
jgi:hypothetical protein